MKKQSQNLYVQYGCGMSSPEGWTNFDASPNLWLERFPLLGIFYIGNKSNGSDTVRQRFPENIDYGDIVKGLPVKENLCDGVFASHVLEHLSLDDCRAALKNTHKILKSGGTFRLIVPDLKALAKKYIHDDSADAAMRFMKDSYLGIPCRSRTFISIIQSALGNGNHLWMWDYLSMEKELKEHGFIDIRRASFNDSNDSNFSVVEDIGRFVDAICIESKKL